MAASGHSVSEPSVHHSLLYRKVNHHFFLTVVDSCEEGLVRLFLDNLDLFNHLGRNVLRCKLRVIKEERLSVDHDLGDSLSIRCDGTVSSDLDSRKLLKKFLKHIVV